ncbi:MAG: peptide chain release factor N(5)-glutamine methyltransferase [Propionibacteriaceae bacterium]|jgi:release factor glutamine methyltransferase|nr:peptide chain release factor N(5)-glutamine methyltransferase [Propionibacteriaceae bacterium]
MALPAHELRLLRELAQSPEQLAEWTRRREAGETLQYLTGEAYFRYETLLVGPGVFVPRPETEVLAGWVIERIGEKPGSPVVVDLCTGSGAIARSISKECPTSEVHAVELSADALTWARKNLEGTGVDLRSGDFKDSFSDLNGLVDIVVSNPPYVPHSRREEVANDVKENEPQMAVFSGDDGLDAIRDLIPTAARLLKPGGWLAFEHDDSQGATVRALLAEHGYSSIETHRDLTGRERFTCAKWGW